MRGQMSTRGEPSIEVGESFYAEWEHPITRKQIHLMFLVGFLDDELASTNDTNHLHRLILHGSLRFLATTSE